MYLNESFVHIG